MYPHYGTSETSSVQCDKKGSVNVGCGLRSIMTNLELGQKSKHFFILNIQVDAYDVLCLQLNSERERHKINKVNTLIIRNEYHISVQLL